MARLTKEQHIQIAKNLARQAKALIASPRPSSILLKDNLTNLQDYVKKPHYFDDDFNNDLITLTIQIGERMNESRNDGDSICRKFPAHISLNQIEPFNGEPASWKRFETLFRDTIAINPNASEIQKLHVLAQAIKSHEELILTMNDCESALLILRNEIADPDAVSVDIDNKATNAPMLPKWPKLTDWTALQKIIQVIIRESDASNQSQQSILHAKLANKLNQKRIDYQVTYPIATLTTLNEYVYAHVRALRKIAVSDSICRQPELTSNAQNGNNRQNVQNSQNSRNSKTKGVFAITTSSTPSESCYFCKEEHYRNKCPLSHNDRIKGCRQHGYCFKCLEKYETNHNCNKKCRNCKNRNLHHLLCDCETKKQKEKKSSTIQENLPNLSTNLLGDKSIDSQLNTVVVQVDSTTLQSEFDLKEPNRFMGIVALNIINPRTGKITSARGLLDPGSETSYMTLRKAREADLDIGQTKPINARPFGTYGGIKINKGTSFRIQSKINPEIQNDISLFVVSGVMLGDLPRPTPELKAYADARGIVLADLAVGEGTEEIDILFGVDLYTTHFLTESQQIYKPIDTLAYVETPYGWILQGGTASLPQRCLQTNLIFINDNSFESCTCNDLSKIIKDPLSDGIEDKMQQNWQDEYICKIIYHKDIKRFEAPLPWITDDRPKYNFAESKSYAFRLRQTLKKKGGFEAYSNEMHEFVRNDFARIVPSNSFNDGHYIRHFPVYKAGSTTSIRPVFDASASSATSRSLNQCIFKGAWAQTELLDIVLKWRLNPIVLLADIRKAFLQIKLKPNDCKYVRFLWFIGEDLHAFEMTSLLFGASASPFILYAVLKRLLLMEAPALAELTSNIYMDDIVLLAESLPFLKELLQHLSTVMLQGSFVLHKLTAIPHVAKEMDIKVEKETSTCLGIQWNLIHDIIYFRSRDKPVRFTRRNLLSYFAQVFDPLGLLGPMHTRIKLFLQSVIKSNRCWDDEISTELDKEAIMLIQDLDNLSKIEIPRKVRSSNSFEIWIFGDASARAYGIGVYVHDLQTHDTQLLMSRGHLAAQKQTIPRLELVSAVLAAETWTLCRKSLPSFPHRIRFFTDSQVTYYRIQSSASKYEPYISTRLLRIHAATEQKDWFHIPGKQNPADLISRGTSLTELVKNKLWFNGPSFSDIENAVTATSTLTSMVNKITLISGKLDDDYLEHIVTKLSYPILRFVVSKLLSHMNRYKNMILHYESITKQPDKNGVKLELSTLADLLTWKLIQHIVLKKEINYIDKKESFPKNHPCRRRDIFRDQFGLIRLRRRLNVANISYEAKFPLVLMDHPSVRSYIRYLHEKFDNHSGARGTIVKLVQFVELPNANRIVKRIVADCKTCRRYRTALPFAAPLPPLPTDRVTVGYAFQAIGLDIFGPIRQIAIGPQSTKYYGMIFACTRSRAIHLELIDSRSTEVILRAFSRFSAQYGVPELVRSDNELSFEKLSKSLRIIYKNYFTALREIQEEHGSAITWLFNAPEAPNRGGFYERLIGPVKSAINRCRLAAADDFEKLETLLRDAQRVVNSRPLLTNSHPEPLTPAHLVYGRALNSLPPVKYPVNSRLNVLVEYSRLQKDLDQFWILWKKEYLPTLQANRWPQTVSPEIGELVIIEKDGVSRYAWELARIIRIIPNKENIIRTVLVEPLNGERQRLRAIHRLYPIERLALPPENVVKR